MAARTRPLINWRAQFALNLKAKFALVTGTTILMVAVILTMFLVRQQERTIRDELVRRGMVLTETLAYNCQLPLVTENTLSLERLGNGLLKEGEVGYVEFRNNEGELLVRVGQVDPAAFETGAELWNRNQGTKATWLRNSSGTEFLDVLTQVTLAEASEDDILSSHQSPDPSKVLGAARVGMTTAFAEERIAAMRSLAGQVGIVIALAGSLVAALVIRLITRPLSRLMEGNRRVARGDFSLRLQVRSSDEFGQLASSYNQMAEEVERARELANRYLESLRESAEHLEDANRALRQNNAEITKVSRMKSEFLAVMSHELRTPLNGIIGFSEVLLDEKFGAMNEKQRRFVENTLKSGRHLLTLINDILDLSKVESGRMEIAPEEFEVRQGMDDIQALIRNLATKKNIAIECNNLPRLRANTDPKFFRQIMLNLLSNAIKFTPDGGHVEITVRAVHGKQLRSEPISRAMPPGGREAVPNEELLVVEVQDSGIGIAPEDYDRIFVAFQQLDAVYARKQEGTGLGLSLTRRLVRLLRGDIWFTSRPGEGSRFVFYLPLDFAAEERQSTTRQAFSAADWDEGRVGGAAGERPRVAGEMGHGFHLTDTRVTSDAVWPWGDSDDPADASATEATEPSPVAAAVGTPAAKPPAQGAAETELSVTGERA